jgi:hypothetical protein
MDTDHPDTIYEGHPPQAYDLLLLEAFQKEIVKQSDRFDAMAKELFKLELTIPGLLVTALQLTGNTERISTTMFGVMFFFWSVALITTLYSLFPKNYKVYPNVARGNVPHGISVEQFYSKIARSKQWTLVIASISFFTGIVVAAFTVIGAL